MSTATLTERLLTAEEYAQLDDHGQQTELVGGKVIAMSPPKPRHGLICGNVYWLLRAFVEAGRLGRLTTNDAGVITLRDPDTVRGPDVAYYSYQRLPADADLDEYPSVPPELIFEVKSPSDSWPDITKKVSEYLQIGVNVVCVIDPEQRLAVVHAADAPAQRFAAEEHLEFPQVLPGLRCQVCEFLA